MDIKRTNEKLIKDIEEYNKQEKCCIADGRTEREKYLEQRCEELENRIRKMEIDFKYHKIAVDRLNGITASGQTSIFTDFEKIGGKDE